MKILLVSMSILPRPGGSSIIVENLAGHFDREELVVLGGKGPFGKALPRSSASPRFIYFFSDLSLFGRGRRYFAGIKKWRFRPLVEKIKSVIRKEKIDYVIGVYPNAFYCHAACLAAKALEVPFSSYFHNTYVENREIRDPNAAAIQAEIFAGSEYVFVMSKGMQQYYESKYQLSKVEPLVHTYAELPGPANLSGIPGAHKTQYRLAAIGNFNESNLEATVRFAEAVHDDPRFSLHLYTPVPKLLLQNRGLKPQWIEHHGFVAPDEVHGVLQDYDICVLTHGFSGGYGAVEYRTIFPTRTIPLLLSGKPIIAHSPPGSFLNDFIRENQCAELVDRPEAPAIIEGLERMISDTTYQQELVDAARRAARQFYGPLVVEELKRKLSGNPK